MTDFFSAPILVTAIGLFGGISLGLAARLGQFCTLGAIEDYFYSSSDLRLRMWGIAIGVAIIGSFGLVQFGALNLASTPYLNQHWYPMQSIAGGLLFGYGMAISGNCGFGALARLGGGDLRAFVIVVVMGICAYATISGPLAYGRVWLFPPQQSSPALPGIANDLSALTGISTAAVGITIGLLLLIIAIYPSHVRQSRKTLIWGVIVGLAIVSGWWGTQWVSTDSFDAVPVTTHTFSGPIGESILYIMTASGSELSFGIGSVAGIWIGAFIGSLIKGHFRWEACEDPRELRRQIIGAGLMGVGAVTAVGCSIGQGLSAISVLSYSGPVTLIAIIAGAALGLRQIMVGFANPI
ncbi:YeeE/YedE family protein [Cohaesibacter celericrescens]|uniref:YeeE/YedE family protein n=1 Tax=Cohaesibacter celericrescens TaxID=2067669 RepID=A0A2N5XTM6_9HYPH|nr:YeeE/YedE family protein [Cohaesibacter celericrescens]PLW77830.1 YeeE/YedE family protein [Cohaesibacter celericrescens]